MKKALLATYVAVLIAFATSANAQQIKLNLDSLPGRHFMEFSEYVEVLTINTGKGQLIVINAIGRELYAQKNRTIFDLPIGTWPAGMYLLSDGKVAIRIKK